MGISLCLHGGFGRRRKRREETRQWRRKRETEKEQKGKEEEGSGGEGEMEGGVEGGIIHPAWRRWRKLSIDPNGSGGGVMWRISPANNEKLAPRHI